MNGLDIWIKGNGPRKTNGFSGLSLREAVKFQKGG